MFSNFEVGKACLVTCVIKEVSARETKARKPYLSMKLFDGIDTLDANYWDWNGVKMPDRGLVVDINGQVTEYNGAKQITVKAISANTERPVSDFMPSSGADVNKAFLDAYELAGTITDDFLRDLALSLYEALKERWLTIPGAKTVHHAYVGGTLIHSLSVAKIARAMSTKIVGSNTDLCIAGALFHDLGKLFTYCLNGVNIDMTDEGMAYEHAFIGAEFISNFADEHFGEVNSDKMFLLKHIILSHHGSLEHGAVITPKCIEAFIVHHADVTDAAAEMIRVQSAKSTSKWTDKIWALGNVPLLSSDWVSEVFE